MRQPGPERRRLLRTLTAAVLIGAFVPSVAAQNPLTDDDVRFPREV